ncbi:hypothetical protein SAMN05877753_10857 [Bacillus oleivorans]|uniref:Phr family secreted Rap phosphatase inhibitor n=1 Tax=Bacillus oleivorans TaxID=1448271 RepID=A0A285D2A8_9BACI|nr:hypothetical protein [Bacillus oleivorans]SNX73957.1 hypothetical protein SAMN05877753_10857 [Bacillus oleivorans]
MNKGRKRYLFKLVLLGVLLGTAFGFGASVDIAEHGEIRDGEHGEIRD